MTDHEALQKIAFCLIGIERSQLSKAEETIYSILEEQKLVKTDLNTDEVRLTGKGRRK